MYRVKIAWLEREHVVQVDPGVRVGHGALHAGPRLPRGAVRCRAEWSFAPEGPSIWCITSSPQIRIQLDHSCKKKHDLEVKTQNEMNRYNDDKLLSPATRAFLVNNGTPYSGLTLAVRARGAVQ